MPNDSKHIQTGLSLISTDWLCLRAAQVPRCRDLAIFMVTTTDGSTDYPCACVRGNLYLLVDYRVCIELAAGFGFLVVLILFILAFFLCITGGDGNILLKMHCS